MFLGAFLAPVLFVRVATRYIDIHGPFRFVEECGYTHRVSIADNRYSPSFEHRKEKLGHSLRRASPTDSIFQNDLDPPQHHFQDTEGASVFFFRYL